MLADVLAQGAAQDLAQGLVAVGGDALGLLLERRFDADHDERFCRHISIIPCITKYVYSLGKQIPAALGKRVLGRLGRFVSCDYVNYKPHVKGGAGSERCVTKEFELI